jgi:hypothetical protein
MKLVQMPVEFIHLDEADLPSLGIEAGLLAELRRYLEGEPESLAILAPPEAGSRALLMVLARRVGAALRDDNIRLRDRGGDLGTHRKKLCYLPGAALPEALRTPSARRTLEREAAAFFEELEAAWRAEGTDAEPLAPSAFLELLDARSARGLPTYLSASPRALPPGLERELRARLRILEPARRLASQPPRHTAAE